MGAQQIDKVPNLVKIASEWDQVTVALGPSSIGHFVIPS